MYKIEAARITDMTKRHFTCDDAFVGLDSEKVLRKKFVTLFGGKEKDWQIIKKEPIKNV